MTWKNGGINWTDKTWNPWWGCTKVSAGCKHCYISGFLKWQGHEPFAGPIRTGKDTWAKPFRWNRKAQKEGKEYKVFTCSMSDFFHAGADAWRDEAWEIIRDTPNLTYQILTKRDEGIADRLPADWGDGYPNVWLGVTIEEQAVMHRLEMLQAIPAEVRFVSAEPLLGPLEFPNFHGIHWVITGCESGRKRRPMKMDWVRSIRDQCSNAGVALWHKQQVEGKKINKKQPRIDGNVHQAFPL